MDWTRIFEILITSITSIVVALVSAGFFKRYSQKKYSSETHKMKKEYRAAILTHLQDLKKAAMFNPEN